MSENTFTLEQVTEMAGRVRHWRESAQNLPYFTHYVGEIRPKWYSGDKLEIRVGRITMPNEDSACAPQYKYSAIVYFGGEEVATYGGDDVSKPFEIAYQKKQQKEVKMQMAMQDLRALVSSTPEESSVVKPVTVEDILGLIGKLDECYDCSLEFGRVHVKFEGRIKVEGQNYKVLFFKIYHPIKNEFTAKVLFNGEKVFESSDYDAWTEIFSQASARRQNIRKEDQDKLRKEKLEKMKAALFKKSGGEKA